MDAIGLARFLGWFSLALGAAEIAAPATLSRRLGLGGGAWLVRGFGLREVAAGCLVLARPADPAGPASRVAGDAMDIAVLAAACRPSNRNRPAAVLALCLVVGITALDVLCTASLAGRARRR